MKVEKLIKTNVQNRGETLNLTSAFEITYANKTCRIFITTNENVCFLCQSREHKGEDCPRHHLNEPSNNIQTDKDTEMDTSLPLENTNNFPPLTEIYSPAAPPDSQDINRKMLSPNQQSPPKSQLPPPADTSKRKVSTVSSSSSIAPPEKKKIKETQPAKDAVQPTSPKNNDTQHTSNEEVLCLPP